MSKYEPLKQFLAGTRRAMVELSFRDIERIIADKLPESAVRHRAFWANNAEGHAHSRAWLDAGYESENVDLPGKRIVFRRVARASGPPNEEDRRLGEERLRQLMGCMKGTVRIPAGVDIMEPIALEWDADKGIIGGEGSSS